MHGSNTAVELSKGARLHHLFNTLIHDVIRLPPFGIAAEQIAIVAHFYSQLRASPRPVTGTEKHTITAGAQRLLLPLRSTLSFRRIRMVQSITVDVGAGSRFSHPQGFHSPKDVLKTPRRGPRFALFKQPFRDPNPNIQPLLSQLESPPQTWNSTLVVSLDQLHLDPPPS